MAIIKCPKCGKEISDKGMICPGCMTPMSEIENYMKSKKSDSKKSGLGGKLLTSIIVFSLVYGIGSFLFLDDEKELPKTSSQEQIHQEDVSKPKEPEYKSAAFDDRSKPVTNSNSKKEASSNKPEETTLDDLVSAFELSLSQGGFTGYTVEKDDAGINVNIWMDGMALDIASIQASGGGPDNESWVVAKNSAISMATSFRDMMDSFGHNNALLVINVLNDLDRSKRLLSILNTDIIYDVLA